MTLAVLALLSAAVIAAAERPRLKPLFRRLPVPLWCYALPMGLVHATPLELSNGAYFFLTAGVLPLVLAMMLFSVDLAPLLRSGYRLGLVFLAGPCGMLLGMTAGYALFGAAAAEEGWKGAGALAATWTGGSLNLISVTEMLDASPELLGILIVVDTGLAYGWMALLIALQPHEARINRWLHAVEPDWTPSPQRAARPMPRLVCWSIAAALVPAAHWLSAYLPVSAVISSQKGWILISVTTFALLLHVWPPLRHTAASQQPAAQWGLYWVLAGMGARAQLDAWGSIGLWFCIGATALCIHALVLLAVGRWLKLPLGILAGMSQSNVGGVISGPLVAGTFRSSYIPIALLSALACGALGSYVGLIVAQLCRLL